ncbi:MAG TPA: hypothetical protein VLZ10_02040 [Thermodesulfobacteriota bacterium]|nr:hypothetical protein [Thermodesulfobacteriota bacterium]
MHSWLFTEPIHDSGLRLDPFGATKPRLSRRGEEVPLRVNPEQAWAFRPESRRVDFPGIFQYYAGGEVGSDVIENRDPNQSGLCQAQLEQITFISSEKDIR